MTTSEPIEGANQDQTADEPSSGAVPNIREGAVDGHSHDELPRANKSTTLVGRGDAGDVDPPDPYAKPDAQPGADADGFGGDAPEPAEDDQPGGDGGTLGAEQPADGVATGDGSGEPAPAIDPAGEPVGEVHDADAGATEATGPEGTPIGDAAEQATDQASGDSSGAGAPDNDAAPASDASSSQG